jgi:predicted transcriptional regulator YdeE
VRQVPKKITEHWQRFYREQILEKTPNKKNSKIIALYTDYEGDQTKPYTLILGGEVVNTDIIPDGMVICRIPAQKYTVFTAKGMMPQALVQTWQEIWKANIQRKFNFDFELYDEKSNMGDKSEVNIHIAII